MQGLIFILVGPGGAGKNSLMKTVLPRFDHLRQIPTATTRPPRPGEEEGREHLFVSTEGFHDLITQGALIEHEEVHPGKFYGVPRMVVEAAIAEDRDLIADVELAGAAKIRTAYPKNTVLIFIAPPSLDVLESRMRERGENDHGIAERVARAERDMTFQAECDYVIVNTEFEQASEQLYQIIATERSRRHERALINMG
ncbi:MAG: guanylate kinase [Anaerolineae bacterium]|nr:guanylate kinase [Anaerolineae bacterium]